VQDALHHSSLAFIRSLGLDSKKMQVEVTIGVQEPAKVDAAAVKASLPHGQVEVNVIKGGLNVPEGEGHDLAVIASAAISGIGRNRSKNSKTPASTDTRPEASGEIRPAISAMRSTGSMFTGQSETPLRITRPICTPAA